MTRSLLRTPHAAALTGLALAGLSAGLSAGAQTLPAPAATDADKPADQAAAPPGEARQLEAVTVTAERRTTNARNVPMAVSVLRSEVMDALKSSGDTVIALAARTPSVNAETSAGRTFPRFYIRGYGNTDFQTNSSQPVSLVVDDVVQENAYLKGFPAFDIAQVEVLRGPQGTLFGRNSPAGVIKFDSVKPQRQAGGYASLSYGTFGTRNVEAVVNTPLSEAWAARISLLSQHRDHWVRNDHAAGPTREMEGYDDNAVRAQALYAPGGGFTALFNLHGRDLDGSQRLFRANAITPGTNDLAPGFDIRRTASDAVNRSTLTAHGGSARLSWVLGEHALHSITGYEAMKTFARGDVDGGISAAQATPATAASITPFPSETSTELPNLRQLSQELRMESRYAGPLNWQAGLYLFDERYAFVNNDYNSPAGTLNSTARFHQQTRSAAVFGSASYQLTPSLKVQGGLRYTRDTKSFDTESAQGVAFNGATSAHPRDGKLSWDLSGTYALDAATTLYARAANAYRATSVQPPSAFANLSVAKPETNTSIEAGVKADLWQRRARLSLAAFDYEVKNQQLSVIGGSSNSNTLINARKTRGRGMEFDLQALVSDNFVVTAGGSYNLTRIADPGLRVAACGNGCTVKDPVVTPANPALGVFSPIVSIDGNALPQAPRWTGSLTAKYTLPTEQGEWVVFTDWAYRGKMNLFLYESVEFTAKSSLEGGLRVAYRWDAGKYELAGFARNITNQRRITGAVDFNNFTAMVNDPRTFGAQLRVVF